MNSRILLRNLNVVVCGLTAAAFVACGDDGDGGGSGGKGGASASSSSSASSGSTSSSATSTSSTGAGGAAAVSLIDDMEDGNNAIVVEGGRVGYWFSFNDGTGTQTPSADEAFVMAQLTPPHDGSTSAAHTAGSGFTDYVGIGFNLNSPTPDKEVYDASDYTGITFWAKKAQGSDGGVRLDVADVNTDPVGAVCSVSCFDYFGAELVLTDDWVSYELPFAELAQIGFGDPAPAALDPTKLYTIQFKVLPPTGDFDFFIDDIAFYK